MRTSAICNIRGCMSRQLVHPKISHETKVHLCEKIQIQVAMRSKSDAITRIASSSILVHQMPMRVRRVPMACPQRCQLSKVRSAHGRLRCRGIVSLSHALPKLSIQPAHQLTSSPALILITLYLPQEWRHHRAAEYLSPSQQLQQRPPRSKHRRSP